MYFWVTPTIRLPKQQIVSLRTHRHKTPCNFTAHCVRFSVVVGNNRIILYYKVTPQLKVVGISVITSCDGALIFFKQNCIRIHPSTDNLN